MDNISVDLKYVNLPYSYIRELFARGYSCHGEQHKYFKETVCVSLENKRMYIMTPSHGEAIINNLEDLDALILLASTSNREALAEYIKAEFEICNQ